MSTSVAEVRAQSLVVTEDSLIAPGREHIDPAFVAKEISELETKTVNLKHYVDKRVAHHDKKEIKLVPTHHDLDDAIDFSVVASSKILSDFSKLALRRFSSIRLRLEESFSLPLVSRRRRFLKGRRKDSWVAKLTPIGNLGSVLKG